MVNEINGYPKVLIVGETFRTNGGGGITLLNLFRDWPDGKLAVVTELTGESIKTHNCNTFYRLGKSENKVLFPFSLFNQTEPSGEMQLKEQREIQTKNKLESRSKLLSLVKKYYYTLLNYSGLYNFIFFMKVSDNLLKWIDVYKPDVVYAQAFNYKNMKFLNELINYLKCKVVLHVVDDSVSFVSGFNLLSFYWKTKINGCFTKLVQKSDILLTISDHMSKEYLKRYSKESFPFRNPIDIDGWLPFAKMDYEINGQTKILYTGRLAVPNIDTVMKFCKAISRLNDKMGMGISFHIYSLDKNKNFIYFVSKLKGINIYEAVKYNEIPYLQSKYDLLLLPIDFTKTGIAYAKYSISTKVSEYMISGVPIIMFGPEEVALSQYAKDNQCMFVIDNPDEKTVEKAIKTLIENVELRKKLGETAINKAKEDADSFKVRKQFLEILSA